MKRVLVIKLAALGDVVQAVWAFQRIREAHPEAEITLLTTPAYAELCAASGLFDRIETDGRPASFAAWVRMVRRLRRAGYDRVYDLQTSGVTRRLRGWFWPRFPEWSGVSPGASHRQTRPDRDALHNLDRIADQLHAAGIADPYPPGQAPAPDLGWAVAGGRGGAGRAAPRFGLTPPFALLAPGASATGAAKMWPAERYAALASALLGRGIAPAVIGGPAERALAARLAGEVPGLIDLTGRTTMVEIAALGAECALFVGNDTGPTHLAAYAGAPGLMLMAAVTRFGHCEPRARMGVIQAERIVDISTQAVLARLEADGLIAPALA